VERRRRIRIIVNPSARSGLGVRALAPLRAAGGAAEWIESRSAEHFVELVRAAQADDLDALGLAGGDGTVTMALAALDGGGPNRVPIGLLPVGSGNDFAHDAGVPRAARDAYAALLDGVPRWVDVARATAPGAAPQRYCCVASVGLDEIALAIIHGAPVRRSKALNLYASLRALVAYRPRAVRLAWEGGTFEGEVMFAAVTNTQSYGGGFRVSPRASVDDGLLDVCIVRRSGRLRLLSQFPRILQGTHGGLPEVVLAASPWVRIEAPEPLAVSYDGELPRAHTPVELRVEPRALQLLVPRAGAALKAVA
jgi:diacylglycerol kinase (ATP)